MWYRNWYWGQCGPWTILEAHHNPMPTAAVCFPDRSWGHSDQTRAINFYSIIKKHNWWQSDRCYQVICSTLPTNCPGYSMVTCPQLGTVPWSQVTWWFLFWNTCSNNVDFTARFIRLNFSNTLDTKRQQKYLLSFLWNRSSLIENNFVRWYFKNANC